MAENDHFFSKRREDFISKDIVRIIYMLSQQERLILEKDKKTKKDRGTCQFLSSTLIV